ncbi:hypothetical protein PR003_g14207 [Phytophthora rubi]|uniref:Uncharacterized protein n=1 Tax=Phytophthora rubi TaxID=129364 RepID=A0A6A4F3L3_9STRA|nr:hypothetical protein PR001_g13414 [Phytophthora rubi]KAE9333078.1 hypothetical protein PR003_g14207 [Phytophthora rubi]
MEERREQEEEERDVTAGPALTVERLDLTSSSAEREDWVTYTK